MSVSEDLLGFLFCLCFFHLLLPLSNQFVVMTIVLVCEQVTIGRSKVSTGQILYSVVPPVVFWLYEHSQKLTTPMVLKNWFYPYSIRLRIKTRSPRDTVNVRISFPINFLDLFAKRIKCLETSKFTTRNLLCSSINTSPPPVKVVKGRCTKGVKCGRCLFNTSRTLPVSPQAALMGTTL